MINSGISLAKIASFDEKLIGVDGLSFRFDEVQGRNPEVRMSMLSMSS
jgi:hypothetical protein